MGLKGFDDRLVKARKEMGFTQEELALRLGVTPQAVSKWERGTGYPDLELLYHISEILECTTDYLLQRDIPRVRLTESNDEQQRKQLLQKLLAEPLVFEAGTGFVELLMEEHKNQFPCIQILRERMASQYGILLPVLRIRDNEEIGATEYRIISYGHILDSKIVKNIAQTTFKDLCEHLERVTLEHFGKIINRQMVKTLVDNVAENYPAVIQGVIPEKVPLALLQKILSGLVEKQIPIRNLVKIIEVLEEEADSSKNVEQLIEIVKSNL
jgi:flagellar biosynthesis component FlhA